MATRTIKFLGKAYSADGDVSLDVSINGNQVHNGTVTTKPVTDITTQQSDDLYEMFEFTIDSSISGVIPVSISVSGGVAYFGILSGNYSGYTLSLNENNEKYIEISPENFYRDLNNNTIESDGKTNISISPSDGDLPTRELLDETQIGDWHYCIPENSTFTCDYYIDPDLEILEVTEI